MELFSVKITLLLFLTVFYCLCSLSITQRHPPPEIRTSMDAVEVDSSFQHKTNKTDKRWSGQAGRSGGARRMLSGLGSSPPRCSSKCGRCTPCKPVHIPVPPGNPVTAEYYPEAWRCKCGNKLYMP